MTKFGVYYQKLTVSFLFHQDSIVCAFLQAFATSIGIRALTYPSLMANWQDGDHHNNDSGDDVNNPVLTRAEFLNFHDENQQFRDSTQ